MDEKAGKACEGKITEKLDLHAGHRKRIYEKIAQGELCKHEYLELLLFSALPRRNTNDIAHRLLAEFGDVQGVLSAPVHQLCRVEGVGESVACFIRTIGILVEEFGKKEEVQYPAHYTLDSFMRFMRAEYADVRCEVLDVYILDEAGNIYGRKRWSSYREKRVEVQLRWFMNLMLDFNPAGIILVHNHPSGECEPSEMDDITTEECRSFCQKNGVLFCDHFVYAPSGIYSYAYEKRLDDK